MQCYVYKGDRKEDHYVYLAEELNADEPDKSLPAAILKLLGELTFVLEFDLTPERTLSQADAQKVLSDIESQGFYLQMPKKDLRAEEDRIFG